MIPSASMRPGPPAALIGQQQQHHQQIHSISAAQQQQQSLERQQLKVEFHQHAQQYQLITNSGQPKLEQNHPTQPAPLQQQQQQQQQAPAQAQTPQQQAHQPQQQQPQQQSQQQLQLGPDGKPKRNPFCSRCRNHGKSAQIKGHKRHCEYRECQCEGCKLVECRQIVSAAQIKRRRYQKQDEEIGRRIEVSPPVLTRTPNSDPAALIAKTLIRSAAKPTSGTTQLVAAVAANQQHLQMQQQQHEAPGHLAIHSAPAAGSAGSSAASSSSAGSSVASNLAGPNALGPLAGGPVLEQSSLHAALMSLAANIDQHLAAAGAATAAASSSAAHGHLGAANSDELFNFNFPANLLGSLGSVSASASAASSGYQSMQSLNHLQLHGPAHSSPLFVNAGEPAPNFAGLCGPTNPAAHSNLGACATVASPPLSIREQFTLVEEIDQSFGPLAVYAWLRSEGFNVPKVRSLIELAKVGFDELLQINGQSPVDLTSPIVD